MNILVTGCNGQLGTKFREFVERNKKCGLLRFNAYYTDVTQGIENDILDITKKEDVEKYIIDQNIDLILNCAAYTNVDKAEDNSVLAKSLNADAVCIMGEIMAKRNGELITISTDYVFSGNVPTPRDTEEYPDGTSIYGLTKSIGENCVKASAQKEGLHYMIVRTAWLYSNVGNNFVKTMLKKMRNGDDIKVVYDQVGSPTNAYDLAEFLFKVINEKLYEGNDGVYHFTNRGVASWYDFTKAIAKLGGFDTEKVSPCLSTEFVQKAKRPNYSVLDTSKTVETFNYVPRYWVNALEQTITELKDVEL